MTYFFASLAILLIALFLFNRNKNKLRESDKQVSVEVIKIDRSIPKKMTNEIPSEISQIFDKSLNDSVPIVKTQEALSSSFSASQDGKNEATKLREKGDHRGAYKASMFLPPIKKGYQIFLQNMGVAGLGFRRADAISFIDDENQTLRLEREPDNVNDENAIKVIGIGDLSEYFLGYLPRDVALQIIKTETFDAVYARLVRAYRGTDDYLEIKFQIIGLKWRKAIFDEFSKNLPALESQKEYLDFWSLDFDKELTFGEAELLISGHSSKARLNSAAWDQYTAFLNLLETFDDEDQCEYYGIKRVPRNVALSVMKELKNEVGSYLELSKDPETIAEKIMSLHPELSLQQ